MTFWMMKRTSVVQPVPFVLFQITGSNRPEAVITDVELTDSKEPEADSQTIKG